MPCFHCRCVQLEASKLKTIVELLGKAKSTYLPAFDRLCVDLRAAHEEASQNVPYLKTIEAELHAMGSSDDFSQVSNSSNEGLTVHARALCIT